MHFRLSHTAAQMEAYLAGLAMVRNFSWQALAQPMTNQMSVSALRIVSARLRTFVNIVRCKKRSAAGAAGSALLLGFQAKLTIILNMSKFEIVSPRFNKTVHASYRENLKFFRLATGFRLTGLPNSLF